MLSFIIPAHNEEKWIVACLASIRAAMDAATEPYEVIVVDDASTDSTLQLAQDAGVQTDHVEYRRISAVRNAGAQMASGTIFFFVDADTRINRQAVASAIAALRAGAVGGGCIPDLEGSIPLWGRIVHVLACGIARRINLVGGCFLFCTREAYDKCGGFAETLYAGEDIAFVQSLKRIGRFVVLKPTVVTSARKLDVVGPWELIALMIKIAIRGPNYDSAWVRDLLYGRRAQDCRTGKY